MEFPALVRVGVIVVVLCIVFALGYGTINVLCQMNAKACQSETECLGGAACIGQRCTPRMCQPVKYGEQWIIQQTHELYEVFVKMIGDVKRST